MNRYFKMALPALAVIAVVMFTSAKQDDGVITKREGMTVVNTTSLSKNVKGFKGSTPVKIYIKKDKVVKVEALPNKETPNFFEKAKSVLVNWEGKAVKKAAKQDVDGVSGATFSSKALIKNVQLGLQYYNEHK